MAGFGWFWKAMGSSTTANQKKSKTIVGEAEKASDRLSDVSDAEVVEIARSCIGSDEARTVEDAPLLLAAVREAASRTLGMRPFDVQLQGALRMLVGDVVEMATGEGKTLVGAMTAVGYGLQGKKVHVITVNSFLAGRDEQWMGPLLDFFGLTHGAIAEEAGPTPGVRSTPATWCSARSTRSASMCCATSSSPAGRTPCVPPPMSPWSMRLTR